MLNSLGITWFDIVFMIIIPISVGFVIFVSIVIFISATLKKHNNIANKDENEIKENINDKTINKEKL